MNKHNLTQELKNRKEQGNPYNQIMVATYEESETIDDDVAKEVVKSIGLKLGTNLKFIKVVRSELEKDIQYILMDILNREDISRIAVPRLMMGLRWFEDIILNSNYKVKTGWISSNLINEEDVNEFYLWDR